jgi:hypothetical protein
MPDENRVALVDIPEGNCYTNIRFADISGGLPFQLGPYESHVYRVDPA